MDNFIKFLFRNRALIVSTCILLIFVLALMNLTKDGFIKWSNLEKRKELILVVIALVNASIVSIGATLAYIKFFKGQIFAHQITATINVDSFAIPGTGNYLHCIAIQLKNVGSIRIWNPEVRMIINDFKPDAPQTPTATESSGWDNLTNTVRRHNEQIRVDPGEEMLFYQTRLVEKTFFVTTYLIQVRSDGFLWDFVKNVNNSSSQIL